MGIFEDTHEEKLSLGELLQKGALSYGRRECPNCSKIFQKNKQGVTV